MLSIIDAVEYRFVTQDIPILPIARGKYLDNLGKLLRLNRDRKENDDAYRKRLSVVFATGG